MIHDVEFVAGSGIRRTTLVPQQGDKETGNQWADRVGVPGLYTLDSVPGQTIFIRDVLPAAPHPFAFAVEIRTWDRTDVIWCRGHDDLVACRVYLAPLAQCLAVEEIAASVPQVMVRAFHAWHGHYPHNVCGECDPLEHQSILRARASSRTKASS